MGLKRIEIDDPRWAALVAACPYSLPYHHPSWAALLAECYGYEPFVMATEDPDGSIRAGVPVIEVKIPLKRPRWVSLPFTDICQAIAPDDPARAALEGSLDAARDERVSQWEIRTKLDGARGLAVPQGYWHDLALSPDADEVFSKFRKKQVQQPIGRAQREGLVVRFADSESDLTETFYRLHLETRRRLGAPIQPKRFFRLLWRNVIESGYGFCLFVMLNEEAIATAVFLSANGRTTYKYSASTPTHWKLRPNNLLLWEAIRHACEKGDRAFDFGRTDLDNEGLRQFKSGWGAVEYELAYTSLGASGAGVAGEAPRPVSWVIQKSPGWVCRAIGETLYKYAA